MKVTRGLRDPNKPFFGGRGVMVPFMPSGTTATPPSKQPSDVKSSERERHLREFAEMVGQEAREHFGWRSEKSGNADDDQHK